MLLATGCDDDRMAYSQGMPRSDWYQFVFHHRGGLLAMQLLVSAFLAILFVQSGLDKILDRRGNLEFLTSHFAKSPLARSVPVMFSVITAVELLAGTLSGVGALAILLGHAPAVALLGALLAALALTMLFFGQRVAKDYAGAAALVPYFLLALAAIWILSQPAGAPM